MHFEADLDDVLPPDLSNRDRVIEAAALHLRLILEVNESMNLTRITAPREAAIKHVLDSVIPWRLISGTRILDAGTGAGFPGIPLAAALDRAQFTLAESTGKKARFVESALEALKLPNARVVNQRAESLCIAQRYDTVVARALAPVSRLCGWLAPACRQGAVALLYKGPDITRELAEAAGELKKHRLKALVEMQYTLPENSGERTILKLTSA